MTSRLPFAIDDLMAEIRGLAPNAAEVSLVLDADAFDEVKKALASHSGIPIADGAKIMVHSDMFIKRREP